MWGKFLRWTVLLILAAILGGHVTELFDHWDHTLRTGKDADYAVVLVAACAGFACALGHGLTSFFRALRKGHGASLWEPPLFYIQENFAGTRSTGPSPPLVVSLRI